MKNVMMISLLLAFVFTACSGDDPISIPPAYTTADAFIQDIGFQGVVLVQQNGTDILRKGYGMADREAGLANDPASRYRIGSLSKAFTAMGIMVLKRQGLISDLDQPINTYLGDFPDGDQITIRHLLTHQSGIPDYVDDAEELAEDDQIFLQPAEIFERVSQYVSEEGLNFSPGSAVEYSNSNFLILGLMIENLSGTDYHSFLQAEILAPLGMTQTEKGADAISGSGYARGYTNGTLDPHYPMQLAFAAGDLSSTLSDLEKWGQAFQGDSWLNAQEKADMFAEVLSEEDLIHIGMGWFSERINNKAVYWHGGNIDGFTSLIAIFPESKGILITLSNETDRDEERDLILNTLAQHEF